MLGYYPVRGRQEQLLLNICEVQSLEDRRRLSDLKFVFNLINGLVDSSSILSGINIYVPMLNSRSRATFYCESSKRNCFRYAPINRLSSVVNNLNHCLDIFHCSIRDKYHVL